MTLESLKAFLQVQLGAEMFASCWERYVDAQSDSSQATAEHVLAWFFEHKLIDFTILENVFLQAAQVEVGAFPSPDEARPSLHRLINQLGQGAMGVVHLAQDQALMRKVAYKELLGSASAPVLRRFLNEVRITAQLEHPAIVPVYQLSIEKSEHDLPRLAYSMKLIKGQTLKEILQQQRLQLDQNQTPDFTQRELLEFFLKVCDAMSFAHTKKVIHRDLKPANLMMGPYGDVYVLDWGIARRFGDKDSEELHSQEFSDSQEPDPDQTQIGQILGTPRYMSPQQAAAKNDQLDGRSDLFALGLILYEILTLQTAYQAKQQMELLKLVLKADVPMMRAYHAKWPVHPALQAIVKRCVQRKVDDRYASVGELATDLRAYLNREPVSVYQAPPLEALIRLLVRHRKATVLSLISVILGSLVVISGSLLWQLYATQQASYRQQALSQILSRAAEQAQSINQLFLDFQGKLEGLSSASQQILLHGQQQPDKLYWTNDLNKSNDLTLDIFSGYQQAISFETPSFELASGVSKNQAQVLAHKLIALQTELKKFFPANPQRANTSARPVWRSQVWLKAGLQISYPAGSSNEFNARLNQTQISGAAPVWEPVYQNPLAQDALWTLEQAVFDEQGQWMGLARCDVQLEQIARSHFALPELKSVQTIYLSNPQGHILLSMPNHAQSKTIEVFTLSQASKETLPPALIAEFKKLQNGVLSVGSAQWVYVYLRALEHYYILYLPSL